MKNEEILEKISLQISGEVSSMGFDLIDISFARGILRLTINKPAGISIDDCVAVNRRVSLLLDTVDAIQGRYHLEVSSPGLTRKLVTLKDFEYFSGRKVKILTAQKTINGSLIGVDGEYIRIDSEGLEVILSLKDIVKANLDY
jgi:ribosome maturation factor RimP